MVDLVAAAGLNKPSIYNTFGGKHDILTKAIGHYAAVQVRMLESLVSARSFRKGLPTLFDGIIEDNSDKPHPTHRISGEPSQRGAHLGHCPDGVGLQYDTRPGGKRALDSSCQRRCCRRVHSSRGVKSHSGELSMPHLPSLRPQSSLLDVFKAFPETSKPLIEFHEVLLRGPSPFTEGERELIATHVSRLNHCRYCQGVHAATAERLGVRKETLEGLAQGLELTTVSERMRPVLQYAEKLTRDPSSVRKMDVEAMLAAGWSETAIYHTVAVTALFNFMNRFVEGLGIELDPAYVPAASKRLAEGGYLPLLEMLRK